MAGHSILIKRNMVELPIINLGIGDQNCRYDGKIWGIARLIECSKNLEVFDYCLKSADLSGSLDFGETMLEHAAHIVKIRNAKLSYPIILHPDGVVMDGRHRILKALSCGKDSIKAVRFGFENLPAECSTYLL